MLCSRWRWCAAAASAEVATLSSWLCRLAHAVAALPPCAAQQHNKDKVTCADSNNNSNNNMTTREQHRQHAQALWDDVLRTAAQAHVMRETDTLCSIAFALLRKGYTPVCLDAWPALADTLLTYSDVELTSVLHYPGTPDALLRRRLATPHSSSNHSSTLSSRSTSTGHTGRRATMAAALSPYHTLPSRETLLMTGGVVPLSARVPCADGEAVAQFVHAYVDHLCGLLAASPSSSTTTTTVAQLATSLCAMQTTLLRVLRRTAATLRYDHVAAPLQRLLACCHVVDCAVVAQRDHAQTTATSSSSSSDAHAGEQTSLLVSLACALCRGELRTRALGARIVLRYLAGEYSGNTARVLWPSSTSSSSWCNAKSNAGGNSGSSGSAATLDVQAERQRMQLLHHCMYALYRDYKRDCDVCSDDGDDSGPAVLVATAAATCVGRPQHGKEGCRDDDDDDDVVTLLRGVYNELDVVLQRNANSGNALQLSSTAQERLRAAVSLTLVRVLRLSLLRRPDAFLRASMPIVDRCAATMAMEAELLAGKVALLDRLALDAGGRAVLYADLVTSLRTLVELQPRSGEEGVTPCEDSGQQGSNSGMTAATTTAATAAAMDDSAATAAARVLPFLPYTPSPRTTEATRRGKTDAAEDDYDDGGRVDEAVWWADADRAPNSGRSDRSIDEQDDDDDGSVLAALSQGVLQEAHVRVLRALCASHDDARIQDAYAIVVAHKYHGLRVTRAVVHPLMAVLSRRGDGRVFGLLDVCMLYSNSAIDMQTLTYLFDTCAAAGDHYRARELMQTLDDVLPGWRVHASPALRTTLRELRLLPSPPPSLFRSAEEALLSAALDGGSNNNSSSSSSSSIDSIDGSGGVVEQAIDAALNAAAAAAFASTS